MFDDDFANGWTLLDQSGYKAATRVTAPTASGSGALLVKFPEIGVEFVDSLDNAKKFEAFSTFCCCRLLSVVVCRG
jgi:hypothetical protein